MILLDASAVLAFTGDEPAADAVEALLQDATERATISAANLAEITDRLIRRFGYEPAAALSGLRLLRASGLDVLFVDDLIAEEAGQLRAQHYHRTTAPLSLADSIALATARREHAPLATTDAVLAAAARAESITVVALPNSTGRRP